MITSDIEWWEVLGTCLCLPVLDHLVLLEETHLASRAEVTQLVLVFALLVDLQVLHGRCHLVAQLQNQFDCNIKFLFTARNVTV